MNTPNVTSIAAHIRRLPGLLVYPSIGAPTRATLLVRVAAGGVFLSSGLVKFLFDNQGPGRFARIGLPAATQLAYFVGATEVICGLLLVLGIFVRLAALPLVVDMVVAIVTTKLPLLIGAGPEPVAAMPKTGIWALLYQSRLDVTMLFSCGYLIFAGAGLWSIDAMLARRRWEHALIGDAHLGGPQASAS